MSRSMRRMMLVELAFLVSACVGTPVQAPGATSPPDMTGGASPARGLAYAQRSLPCRRNGADEFAQSRGAAF